MGKQQNRQTLRMQKALKAAFVQLLHDRDYDAITVGDIAERADVGRSTFYHHYQSKADALLAWHEDIFAALGLGDYTAAAWLANDPPVPLAAFFERMRGSRMPLHNFGKDAPFILRGIASLLTGQIEANLKHSFADECLSIPASVLAHSVAGIFMGLFYSWAMGHYPYTSEEMAAYMHWMVRAAISAAITPS